MPEGERDVEVAVRHLLAGQLDVEPDREPAGLLRPFVGGLHQPRPAARYDGEALVSKPGRHLFGECIPAVGRGQPSRAEDRDGRAVDPCNGLEPPTELVRDLSDVVVLTPRGPFEERPLVHPRALGGDLSALARFHLPLHALPRGGVKPEISVESNDW